MRCHDEEMRTTIDLPDDLHQQALAIARDTKRTLSETVVEVMRRGLRHDVPVQTRRSERTGLPVIDLGRVVTTEDVRTLEDEIP